MIIDDIRVFPHADPAHSDLIAFVNFSLGGMLVVRGVRLIRSGGRRLLAMPRVARKWGQEDAVYPANPEARERLTDALFAAYDREIAGAES